MVESTRLSFGLEGYSVVSCGAICVDINIDPATGAFHDILALIVCKRVQLVRVVATMLLNRRKRW